MAALTPPASAPAHPPADSSPTDQLTITTTTTAAVTSARKRKRNEEHGASTTPAQQLQRDILLILERHDPDALFLNHSFSRAGVNHLSPKKVRLTDAAHSTSTIAAKLASASYDSLQHLQADAATVSGELVASIRSNAATGGRKPTVEELKQIRRVQMIESLIKDVVEREATQEEQHQGEAQKLKKEDSGLAGGQLSKPDQSTKPGTVLTLFGNAPTPKQLFSSMQDPSTAGLDRIAKSELPVEEMSLPNGITATKVMPLPVDDPKGPTFDDEFPPPYSLPALQPPKAQKKSTIRDKDLIWEFKDTVQGSRKGGYTVQPLTVAGWLSYGGTDSTLTSSTREKHKERTRALSSSGESADKPKRINMEDALLKEEEALFRKAFSSFAPICDNSSSVVPETTKSLVWWHKVGNRRYDDTFAIDPALLDETEDTRPPALLAEEAPGDEDFSQLIGNLDELDNIPPHPELAKSRIHVEQVLRDISELLETLASHQRIRNATLPSIGSIARTPLSPALAAAAKVGKADEPSEEELSTYDRLQRELAYLILQLPPYAIAKLNADQFDDLGVSKLITYQTRDTKGVMEEDQVTRQAKVAALATASSIATLARPNSSAGQHYSTTANRTPAIGQAANTRYGQQYNSRTPATAPQFPRQTGNSQTYGTSTTPVPRPHIGQSNSWGRSGTSQAGYGRQVYQRPQQTPNSYSGFNQQYQQSQQAQHRFHQNQQYQPQRTASQAAAANAVAYQTGPSQLNRTVSPAKGYPAVSMAPSAQPRPPYQAQPQQQPGSGRVTPNSFPSQPQTPVNGLQPPHRQPQGIAPRPLSTTPQPLNLAPSTAQGSASVQAGGSHE